MKDASLAILREIEEISSKWEVRPNGNHYNSKISATIYKTDGTWKFVHDGQHKKGATTSEDTILLCFADYLVSGADYANDILENISVTNLSVDSIKEVTGLSDAHIEKLIRHPQNENNVAHRANILPKQINQKLPSLSESLIDWDEVLKNKLKKKPSFRKDRSLDNKPSDVLDSWITTEVLSPNSYKKPADICNDPKKVASLTGTRLPWGKTQKIPEGMTVYYQVYLGAIDVKNASTKLLELYKDDTQERISNSGYAATAVVTVNEEGVPIDDQNDLALSSFPWAYGRSLHNKLEHLRCWNTAATLIKQSLRDILFETNDDGKKLPLNWEKIYHAYNFLVQNCNVPEEDCLSPTFSIKQYKRKPKKDEKPKTPNAPILNSFYLSDLQRIQTALKDKEAGKALQQYIGDISSPDLQDLLKDHDLLESTLSPDNTPAGRWPSAGRHPLVLLQQTAVNIATTTLKEGGLFSINGPPGTGKTTLLRDIVASVIIDRAKALSSFKYPEDAFTKVGDFYELDEKLKGHEILVASSNNNAVENISKELPQLSQIAEDLTDELSYFRTISDAIAEDKYATWGLSAVALGNSKNRSAFANTFWWNDDTSLRTYLKEVRGEEVPLATIKDKKTGEKFQRVPLIIQQEDIPENSQDLEWDWDESCSNFNIALSQSEYLTFNIQDLRQILHQMNEKELELEHSLPLITNMKSEISILDSEIKNTKNDLEHDEMQLKSLEQQKKEYQYLKPNLFEVGSYKLKRAFINDTKSPWGEEYDQCIFALTKKQREVLNLKDIIHTNTKKMKVLQFQYDGIEGEISEIKKDLAQGKSIISRSYKNLQDHLIT